jgi:5-formyltetrahydrofolate cyclo-ligase
MDGKRALRQRLRAARRAHVSALQESTRALLFLRPPRALTDAIPSGATLGVYAEMSEEAPASGYARWFFEQGHPIALPWVAHRDADMTFRAWSNPFDPDALEVGPWGVLQPSAVAPEVEPRIAFVPLVGFTADGARLGMGKGHYDRWLAAHRQCRAIGLAWDCQEVPFLPTEPHDISLAAVITPTRMFGGLEARAE